MTYFFTFILLNTSEILYENTKYFEEREKEKIFYLLSSRKYICFIHTVK